MRCVVLVLLLVLCPVEGAHAQAPAQAPAREGAQAPAKPPAAAGFALPNTSARPWTGDFEGMVKRRRIRFLVPYSKTYYFVDRAVQRGLAYDITRIYEADLNKRRKTGHVRIDVQCIPVSRDEMIPALVAGRGDVVLGNLTITPERLKHVDFTNPFRHDVSEVLVTGPGADPVLSADDLAGKEIYVRKSSSYYESLEKLNAELAAAKKSPVRIRLAPETLEAEDILEMVNAGLVKMTITETYIGEFWKQIFPKLTVHPNIAVRTGGDIAWMIRKQSPQLMTELNGLLARVEKSGQRNELLQRYFKSTRWAKSATSRDELAKFERTVALFRKYGEKYDVEYLLLMAQGYQESELIQSKRSPVGAIGIMQVMPATGRDMRVGDINQIEPNIHAGVKFLRAMMNEYYANEPMDRFNKGLFTFAAYNAGPGRVRQLRKLAAQRGLDPNVWFNNVELVAAEKIGRETVTYVSNIYKYYLAYQLIEEERAERQRTKETIRQGN
jgi:membrane-bound lytic murein transglycosylase MltF